jgi:translation initiation factor 2 subunit 3
MDAHVVIGLVGHVANGKTTIVKALSGIETRRDSSEKSSGRTTKLGYAGCLLWRCAECQSNYSSGRECNEMKCVGCGKGAVVSRRISFVDCPGHHSYVATMARGGAVMDGAIIVMDVRSTELQPQTIEHLAILEMMNLHNVLVIQNKVDLTTVETCLSNREMLQRELSGTVAEGAPILLLSAQSGKGISRLVDYLYDLTDPSRLSLKASPTLSVIRSFDVNRPGTLDEDKKGGVLGVVTLGHREFKIGDQIEIRPNYSDAKAPLTTTIVSIFVEKEPKEKIERGCLHGIGTTLPPEMTQADRLVGCVAGFPEDLPPTIRGFRCHIKKMKGVKESIKKGNIYNFIIGTKQSRVICTERTERAGEKEYTFATPENAPLCITADRCLIYTVKMELIGIGLFLTEKKDTHETAVVTPLLSVYEEEVEAFPFSDDYKKEKFPVLRVARENRNSLWLNGRAFATYIKRDLESICVFLRQETLTAVSVLPDGIVRFYKYPLSEGRIQSLISKYLKTIMCKECKSAHTTVSEHSMLKCTRCGALTAKN